MHIFKYKRGPDRLGLWICKCGEIELLTGNGDCTGEKISTGDKFDTQI